ncbi:unnamed protein product [Caenorhabditis auriculariae]|uniref:Uncharacterized protein n=1 Tax=Caenorhabditis auriculariae TaxID=2777116 RepID=A0A8S1GQ89_9PELO|nr:unnamed protein product [Caenorhabditis auriculariae]
MFFQIFLLFALFSCVVMKEQCNSNHDCDSLMLSKLFLLLFLIICAFVKQGEPCKRSRECAYPQLCVEGIEKNKKSTSTTAMLNKIFLVLVLVPCVMTMLSRCTKQSDCHYSICLFRHCLLHT